MAAVLWGLSMPLAPCLRRRRAAAAPDRRARRAGGVGLVLYFALVHFSGAQPLGPLLRRLRRTPPEA